MLQFDLKVSKYQKIPLFLRIVTLYIVRCGEGLSPPPQLATKLKRQSQDYHQYLIRDFTRFNQIFWPNFFGALIFCQTFSDPELFLGQKSFWINISFGKKLFAGGPPANNFLFSGGPLANNFLFVEGPPANKFLFVRSKRCKLESWSTQ